MANATTLLRTASSLKYVHALPSGGTLVPALALNTYLVPGIRDAHSIGLLGLASCWFHVTSCMPRHATSQRPCCSTNCWVPPKCWVPSKYWVPTKCGYCQLVGYRQAQFTRHGQNTRCQSADLTDHKKFGKAMCYSCVKCGAIMLAQHTGA